MDAMQEVRDLDYRLNAATDPAEMRALITRRRLVRARLAFEHAIEQIRADASVESIEPAFKTIEEWRSLGRI